MKRIILFLLILGQFEAAWTQKNTLNIDKVYQMNHKIEIPTSLGLFAVNAKAINVFKNKTPLNVDQITSLDKNDIWKIDRIAVEQTYSATFHKNTRTTSDWLRDASAFLPAILYFDKNIRKDLFNIVFLYLETQAINSTLYIFAGVAFTNRIRPFVYYPDVSLESKFGRGAQDSFFSGHVSIAATGILVPTLHKVKLGKKQNLSFVPYPAGRTGFSVQLNF
ncbi:MAG: hypothetical protein V3W20_14735 [Candidatus Neomarinimicrobiota bacterium]